MTPATWYLLVLDGLLLASWAGWFLVRRAADRNYDVATAVALAGAFERVGEIAYDGAMRARESSPAFVVHWDRARELDTIAGYIRRGIIVLSAVVLVSAAMVLIP